MPQMLPAFYDHLPATWDERKPFLTNNLLYVPDRYEDHHLFTLPSFSELFGNVNPVHLEYCSGTGAWIIEKARLHPHINWVALEWRIDRARKIWDRREAHKISNLFIVCGEGLTFSRHYLPAESLARAYINFPDPWPKRRHSKNRLVRSEFVRELSRALLPQSLFIAVTDFASYGQEIAKEVLAHPLFAPKFEPPHYVTDWRDYGSSYFEELWRSQGKEIHYYAFEKQ